ncbi:MAG: guanylate kinase [Alphaproteobacteria bacterium]|nr:guanylate kinase [Alphaproteobacteria bacterium]
MVERRGLMLVLSSPSGAGKTSISRELLSRDKNLFMSVSATTRPKRPGEIEGKDYYFVSPEGFEGMVTRGEFLEHATVFGNRYGTPIAPVEKALAEGHDVLFDIDWQGTQQIASKLPDDLVTVFVLPPSTKDLEERLKTRAQDPPEVVAQRMAKAADEMSHWDAYDYIVINRDLAQSVGEVQAVLAAERLSRRRLIGVSEFVSRLREGR